VERVRGVCRDIAAGRFEKVVAARCARLTFSTPIDLDAVLARLARHDPGCTLFAFGWDDALFVGATPERLVTRAGSLVQTEALAGSGGNSSPAGAERLLASGKDLDEHALVVRELRRTLEPLCASVTGPCGPGVRTLRDVLHLHTPLSGLLHRPVHVLSLVERLHPTPAVGGVPTAAALTWIEREEPTKRGWYASPIGWFDANGDGQFALALRSGLLTGRFAHVFAGAGIVSQSDPRSELEETRLKLRSLLAALGDGP
jgi:isochorismate synthase